MAFLGIVFLVVAAWLVDSGIQNRPPVGTIRDLIQKPQPLSDALASSKGTWQPTSGTTTGTASTTSNAVSSSSFSGPSHPSGVSGNMPASQLTALSWAPTKKLRTDAAAALEALNNTYKLQFGHNLQVTDAYRSYADQVIVKAEKGGLAATPGTSNHGWGIAVDLGGISYGNAMDTWMLQNAPKYGWHRPSWATPNGSGPHEPWHWEYGA